MGVGLNTGLALQTPEVTVTSSATIADADLEDWKDQIEKNERKNPRLFFFALGYAF